MRTTCAGVLFVCFLVGWVGTASNADAATSTIPSSLTGGFAANGTFSNSGASQNYFAGSTATGPTPDRRNFFIFDLASASLPIASAKLKLRMPLIPTPPTPGYFSDDPSETYRLSDTGPFTPADFTFPTYTAPEIAARHSVLGAGTLFGSAPVTAAMAGTDVDFTLSGAALASLNAALGGFWVLGGQVSTLDGTSPDELIWGFSDLGAPHMAGVGPRLEITTIPEPIAPSLFAFAALAIMRPRARRKSQNATCCPAAA